jgi:hypothetical protein
MEPQSSLPYSQVPATCPYPEPAPSSQTKEYLMTMTIIISEVIWPWYVVNITGILNDTVIILLLFDIDVLIKESKACYGDNRET